MDKNTFVERLVNCSDVKNLEISLIANLYNKIILAEKIGKEVFTNEFYPPSIWSTLLKLNSSFNVSFHTYGVFDEAERRILGISDKNIEHFPVKLLKIKANAKFCSLSHRDFLGSIMSLGIIREKFGDLILKNDICYAAVHEDICDYLIYNLSKVKNSPCSVEVLDSQCEEKPKHEYECINILSTSLRLDCIVSSICNISRNKSDEFIRQGKVLVDYFPETKRDFMVNLNNLIVIRGYGKFIIYKIIGVSGSGRLKIQIKKYN